MSIEEFREICLVLSPFMNPPLICAIQAALSSCNLVALPLMEGSSDVS